MIVFPKSKINIGLFIVGVKEDGFHELSSVFYPLSLNDCLEMRKTDAETTFAISGIGADVDVSANQNNTVLRAYEMLKMDFVNLPHLKIHLDKGIPTFAGLAGGSSDGTMALKLMNYLCELGLTDRELGCYAKRLGSDCAFFLQDKPQLVGGVGDVLQQINLKLSQYYILLVKPPVNISTVEAYKDVEISKEYYDLKKLDVKDIRNWKNYIRNDFEKSVFKKYPLLEQIKNTLYKNGALYSQMSGSGATIYGIFDKRPNVDNMHFSLDYFIHCEKLD